MKILNVKTSRNYPVVLDRGWHNTIEAGKICVVTDSNVAPLHLKQFQSQLCGEVYSYTVEAGEHSKCGKVYLNICSFLAQHNFSRKDALVALGGGVVGDLCGFVAATYMRGIAFYQAPTTLLAMIDSSVGGKTAIDLPEGKNLVGAFYQPNAVYVNLDTLDTLPKCEMDNGKGELAKYAFLNGQITPQTLNNVELAVELCLKTKIEIVENDEKENGARKLLNLGHTVGHAIETLSDFTIPHGLCVAKGLSVALRVSQRYYGLSQGKYEQMRQLLDGFGLDLTVSYTVEQIVNKVLQDKKAANNNVDFVFVHDIGDCRVQQISLQQLYELM